MAGDIRAPQVTWRPGEDEFVRSNPARLMRALGFVTWEEFHRWSTAHRAEFWRTMIETLGIRFRRAPEEILDLSSGVESPVWLPGGELNIAESCFQADPGAPAVIWRDAGPDLARLTYAELERLSNRVANGIVAAGLGAGDAIAVDLPMTVESVAIYLGIVKAGAVVVSIADSFAPDEIAARLRIAGARAIFTQDVVRRATRELPLYEKVRQAGAPRAVVLAAGPEPAGDLRPGDLAWDEFLVDSDTFEAAARRPNDPINILFSSGTTGDPKAIPWTQLTPVKAASDGWLHQDIRPGHVVAWPTNLGWMMGPWLIFATLVNRATIALFPDDPTGRGFCEFVADAGVNMLGLVPSLVRAWRTGGHVDGLDWTGIHAFSSTGECSSADDMRWLMERAGNRPVIEYCGGTEIGGGYLTGTVVQPAAPACFTTPAAGLDLVILDAHGAPADDGEVFLVPPSIGLSERLLNRDHHEVYFDGTPVGPNGETLRRHGDQIERLGGFFRAHGRVDDTMNLGGIKVSATAIERLLNSVPGVAETAAVARSPAAGGPAELVVFAVPEPGAALEPGALRAVFQQEIRAHLNPLFKVAEVRLATSLPRTASNKVMRRLLREES